MASTSMSQLITLYSRYCVGIDSMDSELFTTCFTEDAVIESSAGTVQGHDEIRKWMRLSRAGLLHQFSNIVLIEESGPSAVCRADWIIIDAGAIIAVGSYADVVQTDDRGVSRFRKRSIQYTWRKDQPST
ncbi:nuclear transport factor 2 family protein (plasmid) [Arthrobacter sp. Z1-9]